jgi:AcrR family transcriptional regulator
MRITTQAKEETRRRIVAAAAALFGDLGFEGTSTRDLAKEAGIATGTLFNYFPSKEALAMALVSGALERGTRGFHERRRGEESLAEDLFAHVAAGLRELEPHRNFVGEVVETALSPFASTAAGGSAEQARIRHLETVGDVLREHGVGDAQGALTIHLYWTLYLGILAFWSKDDSPKQEDTLVVLDRWLGLFVTSVADETEESDGSQSR